MQQLSNQKSWKAWQGLLYYIGAVIILIFPASFLQVKLGMIGLVLSQILFLAYAIIVTKCHKTPLKEVFPIQKISIVDFIGVLIFAIGAILANLLLACVGMIIFPNDVAQLDSLNEFMFGNGLPKWLIVLIIAGTPAICEEALMRGAFLSHFRGLKKDWLICLIVGIGFGVLHMAPTKLLSTAFLGAVLAYLIVKRNNIVLPMIVHFTNNFFSAVIGVSLDSETISNSASAAASISPVQQLGTFMMIGFLAPVLLLLGAQLLKLTKITWKKWLVAGLLSGVFFITGIGCMAYYMMNMDTLTKFTDNCIVSDEVNSYEFVVEEDGTYQVVISGTISEGGIDVVIVDRDTDEIVTTDAFGNGMFVFNQNLELEPGNYLINITENTEETDSADLVLSCQIVKLA